MRIYRNVMSVVKYDTTAMVPAYSLTLLGASDCLVSDASTSSALPSASGNLLWLTGNPSLCPLLCCLWLAGGHALNGPTCPANCCCSPVYCETGAQHWHGILTHNPSPILTHTLELFFPLLVCIDLSRCSSQIRLIDGWINQSDNFICTAVNHF